MALFSRGSKTTGSDNGDSEAPEAAAEVEAASTSTDAVTADSTAADAAGGPAADANTASAVDAATTADVSGAQDVPQVGISTTSYGGFGAGAAQPAAPQATASQPTGEPPAPAETIPGLPDNVVLRGSLGALGENPEPHEILGVARQLLQGNVYLRVKGNAQELMNAGEALPLAVATRDEGQFVMLYSSGAALAAAVQADGDTETSAMGQPGPAVLQYVLQGEFAGVMVDHASTPAAVVLPRALIERMVAEWDPQCTLKKLVSGPRTDDTAAQVAEALASTPLWIAVNRASDDDDWGVAESRTASGERILPVFSHPLEVVALGRNDRPMPFSPAQLGQALRGDDGIEGVVVDPVGPWIRVNRDELGAVLALPEPEAAQQIAEEPDAAAEEPDAAAEEPDAAAEEQDAAAEASANAADAASATENATRES
ncbi:SseB family protein [Microbacterium protaetiae]|uniref:SseB family protein n=1 Tax=Microbacterium protaetiae TaxID=2509458 RepID=UPI0013EB2827|nr:SseB family protein [Microbacterium protaetiae]